MGMFSIYTGLLYNDVFSKSLNIFGSSWQVKYDEEDILEMNEQMINPKHHNEWYGTPYPFGVDPVWQVKAIFLARNFI